MRLAFLQRIVQRGGGKGFAYGSVPQPRRIRWTNINDRVMDMRRTTGPELRHLHPAVFCKMRSHNLVGVLDLAVSWYLDWLRHFHDKVGLRDVPTICPFPRWRRIVRVPGASARIGPVRNRRDLLFT